VHLFWGKCIGGPADGKVLSAAGEILHVAEPPSFPAFAYDEFSRAASMQETVKIARYKWMPLWREGAEVGGKWVFIPDDGWTPATMEET
jgi:hypothetical protein